MISTLPPIAPGPKCVEKAGESQKERGDPSACRLMQRDGNWSGLSSQGIDAPVPWIEPEVCSKAEALLLEMASGRGILRNPHAEDVWLREQLIRRPAKRIVEPLLGREVAVENVFAVLKHPDGEFEIPWHQDGINANLELVPDRALAVWVAITESTSLNGCLEAIAYSHRDGYRPIAISEEDQDGAGKPTITTGLGSLHNVSQIPLGRGRACLMDVRTLHRSRANHTSHVRIGLNIRFVGRGGIKRVTDAERKLLSIDDAFEPTAEEYLAGKRTI